MGEFSRPGEGPGRGGRNALLTEAGDMAGSATVGDDTVTPHTEQARPRARPQPSTAIRALGAATGLLILWGTSMNVASDAGFLDYTQAGDNTSTKAMAAIMVLLPLLGAVFGGIWALFGFGAGAALISGAWASCAVAVTFQHARGAIGRGEAAPKIAVFVFFAAAVTGVATFVLATRVRHDADLARRVPGPQWMLGLVSTVVLVVGLMLPAGELDAGILEYSFDIVGEPTNLAWLGLVAAFGVVGVLGFTSRTTFGLASVLAALVPLAWAMLVYRKTLDYPAEPGVTLVKTFEVHHLVLYAATGQALAVTIGIGSAAARAVGQLRY